MIKVEATPAWEKGKREEGKASEAGVPRTPSFGELAGKADSMQVRQDIIQHLTEPINSGLTVV